MKYNIKGRTINISYIYNGKVRKLQLNVDDPIDNDFFNKLVKAKSENQDAMCDLFNREILKPHDNNVERVTPLTLTSEIQPTQYTKTEAAKRRAEELKRDKESIKEQLAPLVKAGTNLDDVKSADEATQIASRPEDVPKVKELLVNLLSIDKVYQIAINEAENVKIENAQNVKIEKIQSLAVKMYGEMERYVTEMNLSKQAQDDIMKLIQEALGKVDIKDDTPIPVKYIYQIIPTLTVDQGLKLTKFITDRGPEDTSDISGAEIKRVLGEEYKTVVPRIQDLLLVDRNMDEKDIQFLKNILDTNINIRGHIDKNFEDVFESFINIVTYTDANIPDKLKKNVKIAPSSSFVNIVEIFNEVENISDFKTTLVDFGVISNDKAGLEELNFARICQHFGIAIYSSGKDKKPITNNQLLKLLCKPVGENKDKVFNIDFDVEINKKYAYTMNIFIVELEYLKTQKEWIIDSFIKMISWIKTAYPLFELGDFTFYINYKTNKTDITGSTFYYTSFVGVGNTEKFIDVLQKAKNSKGIEVKPNDEGGKLMIDLDSSNFNEKFNELLRLMNQLNYNVYALTPMYQKTKPRFNEKPIEKTDTKKKAKGSGSSRIDLLDVISK